MDDLSLNLDDGDTKISVDNILDNTTNNIEISRLSFSQIPYCPYENLQENGMNQSGYLQKNKNINLQ